MALLLIVIGFLCCGISSGCPPSISSSSGSRSAALPNAAVNTFNSPQFAAEQFRIALSPAPPLNVFAELFKVTLPVDSFSSTTQSPPAPAPAPRAAAGEEFLIVNGTEDSAAGSGAEYDPTASTTTSTSSDSSTSSQPPTSTASVSTTHSTTKRTETTTQMEEPIRLFAPPKKDLSIGCERATVTAVTMMPYDDRLVALDMDRIHQQILLLEAYTQRKLSSFGEYTEETSNVDGQFSVRYEFRSTPDCGQLREYSTKAVSYSREIERIMFTCHCEPMWIIAKRRVG